MDVACARCKVVVIDENVVPTNAGEYVCKRCYLPTDAITLKSWLPYGSARFYIVIVGSLVLAAIIGAEIWVYFRDKHQAESETVLAAEQARVRAQAAPILAAMGPRIAKVAAVPIGTELEPTCEITDPVPLITQPLLAWFAAGRAGHMPSPPSISSHMFSGLFDPTSTDAESNANMKTLLAQHYIAVVAIDRYVPVTGEYGIDQHEGVVTGGSVAARIAVIDVDAARAICGLSVTLEVVRTPISIYLDLESSMTYELEKQLWENVDKAGAPHGLVFTH